MHMYLDIIIDMNHGIIGKKIIMICKKASIRVLMWEIFIETHYKND